jgi:hypothetical protein
MVWVCGSVCPLLARGFIKPLESNPLSLTDNPQQRLSPENINVDTAVHHYEYVFPEGWMYVYDMDNAGALIKQVSLPTLGGTRGETVSPADGMVYISYGGDGGGNGNGSLLQYNLIRDSLGWIKHYTHGIDSHAMSPDGATIYMPDGELTGDGKWYVVKTSDGSETGVIVTPGQGPHNTIVSLDGAHVYLGDRDINNTGNDSFYVASTTTYQITNRAGRFLSGIRPFTINGTETFAFVTISYLLGFQVCNLTTGQVPYTIDLTTMGFPRTNCGSCATVSHGISLSPDEKEVYVVDAPNSYVHVFDISGLAQNIAPIKLADIHLTHLLTGTDSACAYDCQREGWIHHSLDGRFVFVGESGDVVTTSTRTIVATLPALKNTKQMLEVDWKSGRPIATSTRSGVGYVTHANPIPPAPPTLVSPQDSDVGLPTTLTFKWNASIKATSYRLQVAIDSLFSSVVFDDSVLTDTSQHIATLQYGTMYYWHVRARNINGTSAYSHVRKFSTAQGVAYPAEWNIVSVPGTVSDYRKTILFPTASSVAFAYFGSYTVEETLRNGPGYWLKFPVAESLAFGGALRNSDSIDVVAGWNLVGSISIPVAVTSLTSIPPGLVTSNFFGYVAGYVHSDTILPSRGYWVKVSQGGKLVISSSQSTNVISDRIRIVSTAEAPPPPPVISGTINSLPERFVLQQNFPNPFNPTTIVQYLLPDQSKVMLRIYNVLGQLVTTLVDEIQSAGYKQLQWNATQVVSGIYFYHLEAVSVSDPAKTFTEVKKMVLIK